jgi:DNA polymerase III alpha subunit
LKEKEMVSISVLIGIGVVGIGLFAWAWKKAQEASELLKKAAKLVVRLSGQIDEVRVVTTAKGRRMAFVRLEGGTELIVFPSLYKRQASLLREGNQIYAIGWADQRGGSPQIIVVRELYPLRSIR